VLGLGNVLLTDDGVGPAAITLLRDRHRAPDGALVLDGGTLGLSLLGYVEDADALVLVDAVMADAAPGTLLRLEGADVGPAVATRLSPHQVGVADLLEGADWHERRPRRLILLGIVPASIELGIGLSPAVADAVPELVELVVREARRLGHEFAAASPAPPEQSCDVGRLALGHRLTPIGHRDSGHRLTPIEHRDSGHRLTPIEHRDTDTLRRGAV
jgi:hydrogenase maturation protease